MEQTNTNTKANQMKYDSNPFTLAFSALGRFFQHNLVWAIILIVIGVFGAGAQVVSSAFDGEQNNGTINQQENGTIDKYDFTDNTNGEDPDYLQETSDSKNSASIVVIGLVIVGIFIVVTIIFLISSLIGVLIQGVLTHVALGSEAGKSVGFSEALQASANKFGIFYLSNLLAVIKIFGWSLLFIIPGIIAAYRYALLPYVIMSDKDKKLKSVSDVHNRTKQLVKGRLFEVFGVNVVAGIIPAIGGLLKLSGFAALHNQMAYYHDGKLDKPKVHWVNYLLLGLILFAIVAFLGFIGLILLFASAT